jgi:hypothetical protein
MYIRNYVRVLHNLLRNERRFSARNLFRNERRLSARFLFRLYI